MTSPDRLPPELEAALAEHPESEALTALWSQLPRTAPAPIASGSPAEAARRRDQAYARLSTRLGLAPALRPIPAPRTRRWARAAAAIALILGGAAVWQAVPVSYAVAAGADPRVVTLADGSRITLASGSTLTYARGFRTALARPAAERRVDLEGDAFLEVAKDGRPFVVHTSDATVRVLGTRFEVRAPATGRGTQVAVEEGRVAVSGRAEASARIELAAGHVATIGANGAVERRPDLAAGRIANWRSGGLAIEDEALPAVLADLSRRYGVAITLDGPIVRDDNVTLFYAQAPAVDRVLSDLASARGLRWERTSRGYVLSAADAR